MATVLTPQGTSPRRPQSSRHCVLRSAALQATRAGSTPHAFTSTHPKQTHHRRGRVRTNAEGDAALPEFPRHSNKSVLLKYVSEVDPAVVDTFENSGPPPVVEAIQVTCTSLTGTLPPQFFEVNVVTLGENLRMLMHSFLVTGYLYRHIADHLELQAGLDRALPSGVLQDDLDQDLKPGQRFGFRSETWDGYAKGSNTTDVQGQVVRWNHDKGVDQLDAQTYIEMLEREVEILRQEIAENAEVVREDDDVSGGNAVLAYLRQHAHTHGQHVRPGREVREAMDAFLKRLLGTDNTKELSTVVSETSARELHRLLTWLMVVGYTLRSMEVRFSMEESYKLPCVALEEDRESRDNL